jgi:murein DD-endopeptidase MepM/ murein hydrolase activator NlpD
MSFITLQTLLMATPANAEMLEEMDQVQRVTAKDVRQEPIVKEEFAPTWIVYPVDAGFETMSSDFGYRAKACNACSTNHQGIDFLQPKGSTVRAVFNGTVIEVADNGGGLGSIVLISHPDLGGIQTVYAHLIRGSQTVKVGDSVIPGQKIGKVGLTGTTTAYHLHFGVYVDGYAIDPEKWLKANKVKRFDG